MADLLNALTQAVESLGMIQALFLLGIVGLITYIMYVINKTHKSDKQTIEKQGRELEKVNEVMYSAIKENRDMSEKQLIAINVMTSKVTSYIDISQYLLKEKIQEEGGSNGN
jgi:hypothetical protein